ncbi:MAG: hypothetical protein L0G41_02610 [Psychrobacter sp.]|nr:hypothetical protein [Psychrobacter sp.]
MSDVNTMSIVIEAKSDDQAATRAEQINRVLLKSDFAGWHVVRLNQSDFMVTFYRDADEGMTAHSQAVDDWTSEQGDDQ